MSAELALGFVLDNWQRVGKIPSPMQWIRRLPEAPVTLVLIVVNLLVYAVMAATSRHVMSFDVETLISAGANVMIPGADVSAWRWLTAAFIHVNLLHIVMNLWVLAQIGVLSERAIGRGLFAAAYVGTGVFGNVVSTALAALRHRQGISAGASGAIMGLIGLAAVFAWRTGQRPIARALLGNVVFVLAVGISLSFGGTVAVDNAAHVGGLVVGALLGLVRARVTRPAPRALDASLIVAAAALSATAFAVVHAAGGAR
jgi:rhomboid protease GluP